MCIINYQAGAVLFADAARVLFIRQREGGWIPEHVFCPHATWKAANWDCIHMLYHTILIL